MQKSPNIRPRVDVSYVLEDIKAGDCRNRGYYARRTAREASWQKSRTSRDARRALARELRAEVLHVVEPGVPLYDK